MTALPARLLSCLVAAAFAMPLSAGACVEGAVRGEAVMIEKSVDATAEGERTSMQIIGVGWFRAATVEKLGGVNDQTWVTLELDGEPMFTTSFATLKNAWNQISSAFIVAKVTTDGAKSTLTIWYSPELKFRAIASLRVDVQEPGVEHLRVSVVMNKPAPHEDIPGQPTGTATAALPAFK